MKINAFGTCIKHTSRRTSEQLLLLRNRRFSEKKGENTKSFRSDPDFDQPNWKEGCRGTGWLFGEKALRDFLRALNLQMIIRAHQVVQQGYQFFGHKQLITVFTAPNYCNEFANDGAFLLVSKDLKIQVKILQSSKDENQRETPINYPNFAN